MHLSRTQTLAFLILTAVLLLSCSITDNFSPQEGESDVKVRVAATLTQEALQEAQRATEAEVTLPTATFTPLPPTETAAPTATFTASPSPTPAHVMMPGEPLERVNSHVTDVSSLGYAAEGYTYGDLFPVNNYERPFTSESMEYRGHLDLRLANLKYNPPWVYFILDLQEDLPASGDAMYGVELDLDEEGRGEVFVTAQLPGSSEWTTDGVQVYRDIDGDVGGPNPIFSDAPTEDLTGYEQLIFDSGQGEDPDLAWVRRDPDAADRLQIAFKDDLVGSGGYLWTIWADAGPRDLSLADYNDTWTFQEAGSPFPDHPYYPLKELALVDSTCRSWYGFEPTGAEPGLCQMAGEEKGWKVCYTYYTGNQTMKVCSDVCQAECPDNLPDGYTCERCTMP